MNNKLDQGEIVYKEKFDLIGNAQDIYNSLSLDHLKL